MGRAWHGEVPGLRKALLELRDRYAQAVAQLLAQGMERGDPEGPPPDRVRAPWAHRVGDGTGGGGDRVAKEVRREGPREVAELAWRALRPEEDRG